MAQLPDFTALGERPVPRPAGGIASYQPGTNQLGEQLSQSGARMAQAADIIDATNTYQDRVAAEAALNKLQEYKVNLEFDPSKGFRNIKEGGAVGQPFLDKYTQQLTSAQEAISGSLQNDRQRALFGQRASVASLQFKAGLLAHQAQQTDAFNDRTSNDTIELALRSMATQPTNELNFQTELARVNATVDDAAQRKGLPPAAVTLLKAKMADQAYSTRILSVLNGIPGVVDSNPYLAEKMFRQVQDQLGPTSQVTLAGHVLQGVKAVQQRDLARAIIGGGSVLDPKQIAPAIEGTKPLAGVVMDMESGGRRYDGNGDLITSPAGAQGEMQVMPATAKNPGYGVTPAQNDSPEELARVGRDFLGAMTARYQDPALVLAAYNAGPGNVDKWLGKYGDPRTGAVSATDWAAKIPFSETRAYVTKGLDKLGGNAIPVASITKRELKTELPDLVRQAQDLWSRMYPNDPQGADAVGSRVSAYGNQILAGVQAQQGAAFDSVMRLLVGGAQTVDDITATPEGRQAWSNLTPEGQYTLMNRLKKPDTGLTQEGFNTYYGLLGKAGSDPQAFMDEDLSGYFGKIPDHLLLSLSGMQKSLNAKDAAAQQRDLSWNRAKSAVTDMLKASGIDPNAKPKTLKAEVLEQFYGRYQEALQSYHDANSNKWPSDPDARKIAAGLLAQGAQSGGWLGMSFLPDSKTAFFKSPDPSKFYVPLPDAKTPEYKALAQQFQVATGRQPQGSELQDWFTKYKLAGGK